MTNTLPTRDVVDTSASTDQNRFIAVLAHELRNPIAPIRSGLDLLATDGVDERVRRDTVAMMQRQLAHLVRLMDDLLDTARLSTGVLTVVREPVVLREVLRAAIESIEPALQARAQTLHVTAAEGDAAVLADPVRLTQAFVNILSSNVQQTPLGGTIAIETAERNGQWVVTFADEGPGLDAQQASMVFVMFPSDKATQPDPGLSIGLALVKGLVELNGGEVRVDNRDGVTGSLFTISLPPAEPGIIGDTAASRDPTATADWRSQRVLVVDDNRDAAETLGLLFELDGKTIRLAYDGPSAVTQAHDFQPEIILMDMGLPGYSGLEAVRRIRQAPSAVRPFIVALTGWGSPADREASRAAGVDLHLVKPVSYQALVAALAEAGGSETDDRP